MKNLKSIIAILAISVATTFSTQAIEKEPTESTKELRTEISKLLGTKIPLELKTTTHAEISFMVNSNNEVVVITVDSKVKAFNSFVKNKLNYKKVKANGIKQGEIFKMPVKINASK